MAIWLASVSITLMLLLLLLPSVYTPPARPFPQGRAPLPSPAQPRVLQRSPVASLVASLVQPQHVVERSRDASAATSPDLLVKVLLGLGHVVVDGCDTVDPLLVAAGWDGLLVLAHQVAAAVRTVGNQSQDETGRG